MYFPRFVGLYIFEQFSPVFRSAPLTIVASTVASTARCGTMSRPNETRLVRLHKGMLASAKLGIRLAGDDRPRIVYLDPEAIGARTVGLAVDDVILSVNGETARGRRQTTPFAASKGVDRVSSKRRRWMLHGSRKMWRHALRWRRWTWRCYSR